MQSEARVLSAAFPPAGRRWPGGPDEGDGKPTNHGAREHLIPSSCERRVVLAQPTTAFGWALGRFVSRGHSALVQANAK